MSNCLCQIQNWPELARESGWHTAILAEKCGVSTRTLERFFQETEGMSPKKWLTGERLRQGKELLQKGLAVKEVAYSVGYKHPTHFSRGFKIQWGCCPTTASKSPQLLRV